MRWVVMLLLALWMHNDHQWSHCACLLGLRNDSNMVQDAQDQFDVKEMISKGSFGVIHRVVHKGARQHEAGASC
jgi:hypothetical protein